MVLAAAFLTSIIAWLSGAQAQVIIKQYIEGTGFNKAVQLENRGATPADVSGYVIEERVNVPDGAILERYTFGAGSNINDLFTVCNNQGSSYMTSSLCDDTAAFGINGNDAITLLDASGSAVDRVGEITGTELAGTKWEVSCVKGATADHTLVRAAVSSPPLVPWATGSKQWDVYAKDTFVDSSGKTWNAQTGTEDARTPVSTCTATSSAGAVTPLPATPPTTPAATPTVPSPVTPSTAASPPPPAVPRNAPAIGVEEGNSCAVPTPASMGPFDRRSDKGALRVATFNTEFLFDGENDPSSSRWKDNPTGADDHLQKVAKFIATFQADIINLVEVEGCSNLKSLISEGGAAELDGAYTAYLRQGTDSATGQDVALVTSVDPSEALTRMDGRSDYPVPKSGCGYTSTGNTGVSKNFVATWNSVQIGSEQLKIAVLGLHFKAFPTDKKSCAQREGQAAVVRATIQDLSSSGYEVIALGDINDFSDDPPDAASSKPKSVVLDILTGTLTPSVGKAIPGLSSTPRLYNVMEKMPQKDRYTAWYDRDRDNKNDGTSGGENSAIDHILVSEKLWNLVSEVDIIHEAPEGVKGGVLSDHWPLIVTFGTPDQQTSRSGPADLNVSGTSQSSGKYAIMWACGSALVAFVVHRVLSLVR